MNILAFDLGASSGKLFLATILEQKVSFQEIHRFVNTASRVGGAMYWDIIRIYQEMNEGIKKAIHMTGDQIDSFAIDSFSNDFGLIASNGDLISLVRCYRDDRTARHQKMIYSKMSKEQLYRLSGNQNALFNTLMQLAAMHEDGQGYLLDHADKLLFIPDLLAFFLTGHAVSEYTISSVSQLYDFTRDDWCQEILDIYQIPRSLFAPVVRPGTLIGHTSTAYNEQMGTKGFPVSAVCGHDTASAFLSSPITGDRVLINCGTWALIGTELNSPVITNAGYRANLANEGGYSGHHRLLCNVTGSWLLQECQTAFGNQGRSYTFSEMAQLALQAEPFQFYIDPDADIFFTPGNIPQRIQDDCLAAYGKAPVSDSEILRCIYESLAMKFRFTIETLEEASGKTLPLIHMMGGGSQARILCQFTANATGRKVLSGPTEATAFGNIAAQLTAINAVSSIAEAKNLMASAYQITEFDPTDCKIWTQEFHIFLRRVN